LEDLRKRLALGIIRGMKISDYLADIGKRGGKAGKGAAKKRGGSSYYKRLAAKSAKARAAKRRKESK
jgi:hypothetical protein